MSMKLTAQVLDMSVGSAARKLVLVCLADIAGKDGTCYPSYQHIAKQAEMSKRSVIEHIKQLEAAGLLKKKTRKGQKGNSSNIYKITLEGGENSAPHSENPAPPPSENPAPGVVNDLHGGSENPAPPPSENPAPRTSYYSEPVIEPKEKEIAFDDFWSAYPRKEAKENALRAWNRLSEKERRLAVNGIAKFVEGKQLQFIAHPATYLNGKRWNDQPVAANDPEPQLDGWGGPRI